MATWRTFGRIANRRVDLQRLPRINGGCGQVVFLGVLEQRDQQRFVFGRGVLGELVRGDRAQDRPRVRGEPVDEVPAGGSGNARHLVDRVEVEARGRVFWELNNPTDVARIEAVLANEGQKP